MSDEYTVTVREALDLWECLASMRIDNTDISVLTISQWDTIRNKFEFTIKGGKSKRIYANYDTICIISLKDYTRDIGIMVKRQALIEATKIAWKQKRDMDAYIEKRILERELERRNFEKSLDITRQIPDMEDED